MHPEKRHLNKIGVELTDPIDVFICCGSFEDRSVTIAEHINPNVINHVLVAENRDNIKWVGKNSDYLRKRFGSKSIRVELDTSAPFRGADNFMKALAQIASEKSQSYLVDISTFTRESLLILLCILRLKLKSTDSITCVYVGANRYSLDASGEKTWLTRGVRQIRSILGYPGEMLPSRRTHLIVLLGFETERAATLITNYEPAVLSVGIGSKEQSITQEHYDLNVMFYSQVTALYGDSVRGFSFAPDSHLSTKKSIEDQIQKVGDYNVVVAPMNTKISTVGSALLALELEGVQLCYAQAELYNFENYSKPQEYYYAFQLPELTQV